MDSVWGRGDSWSHTVGKTEYFPKTLHFSTPSFQAHQTTLSRQIWPPSTDARKGLGRKLKHFSDQKEFLYFTLLRLLAAMYPSPVRFFDVSLPPQVQSAPDNNTAKSQAQDNSTFTNTLSFGWIATLTPSMPPLYLKCFSRAQPYSRCPEVIKHCPWLLGPAGLLGKIKLDEQNN